LTLVLSNKYAWPAVNLSLHSFLIFKTFNNLKNYPEVKIILSVICIIHTPNYGVSINLTVFLQTPDADTVIQESHLLSVCLFFKYTQRSHD